MHADRNGHFYVLDRTNGKFLSGTPFMRADVEQRLRRERPADADARIRVEPRGQRRRADHWRRDEFPGAVLQPGDRLGLPRVFGSARSGISATRSRSSRAGSIRAGAAHRRASARTAGIKAIDPEDGKTMWEFPLTQGSLTAGVLATAGGVVFAASREGYLFALDARDGRVALALPDRRGD